MKRRGILALFIFTLFCVAIIFGIVFVARQYKEEEMRKKEELEALYDKM